MNMKNQQKKYFLLYIILKIFLFSKKTHKKVKYGYKCKKSLQRLTPIF